MSETENGNGLTPSSHGLSAAQERVVKVLPDDIAERVLAVGKVGWTAGDAATDEAHLAGLTAQFDATRAHFGTPMETVLHAVSMDTTGHLVCVTGNSPNSELNARAIAGAWNHLVDVAEAQVHGGSAAAAGKSRATDMVDRLRKYRPKNEWGDGEQHTICDEAATLLAALSTENTRLIEDLRERFDQYCNVRDALFQFKYPPDPKLLREIADEIDCGNDCEHGHTEWDTNAHVCSRADSKDGCASEKASCLRQFADAIDASSRLQPAAASEGASREDVEYRYPTYDQLIAELAACRDVATAASGHDDTDAIADPLQVADHVSLALGIPPEHRKSHTPPLGEGKAVAWRWRDSVDEPWSYEPWAYMSDDAVADLRRKHKIVQPLYASPPPSSEGK